MTDNEIPSDDRPVGTPLPGEPSAPPASSPTCPRCARPWSLCNCADRAALMADLGVPPGVNPTACSCGAVALIREDAESWRREAARYRGDAAVSIYLQTHGEYLSQLAARIEIRQRLLQGAQAFSGPLTDDTDDQEDEL